MFNEAQKSEIIAKLNPLLNGAKCPMCSGNAFSLAEAYLRNQLQDDLKTLNLGGRAIPTVAVICTKCGFVSQHALGILGLLPKEQEAPLKAPVGG